MLQTDTAISVNVLEKSCALISVLWCLGILNASYIAAMQIYKYKLA